MSQPIDVENQRQDFEDNKNSFQLFLKIGTIFFYATTSLLLTVINKWILTNYQFPSFAVIALSQMLTTVIVLGSLKRARKIQFPDLRPSTFWNIFPLPILYVGSILLTLDATQELSLPTFTLLRRFSIPMTMVAEYYILSIRPRCEVQLSVYLIVLGGAIAAMDDLSFDLMGYIHVLLADLFVAYQDVFTKERLNNAEDMGKFGLMFYSCLFMLPVALFATYYSGDLALALSYPLWSDSLFVGQFVLSSTLGCVLIYSGMLCTQYNSALTANIVSCSKNIFATYLGMFISDDYVFSYMNFVGINTSVAGSLFYAFLTLRPSEMKTDQHVRVKY